MSWRGDVQAFVDQAVTVRTPRTLHDLMDDITREMGFDHFALVHHVDLSGYSSQLRHMINGEMVALSSYPGAWIDHYVASNYVKYDPVLQASQRVAAGFEWARLPTLVALNSDQRELMDRGARAGVVDGFTIPAHVPGEPNGTCHFVVGPGRELPQRNLMMAQVVGSFAFDAARRMVMRAAGGAPAPGRLLSARQRECVILVARGLTDMQIARRLGIQEATVKQHLADARARFGVAKRVQAVIHALAEGQIAIEEVIDR